MISPLAARRLEILSAARAAPDGFLRFAPGSLRFSLGTSLADLAIPVQLAPDAVAIVHGAAIELALVLSTHHRAFVAGEDLDRIILRDDYAELPPVPVLLGPGGGGPDLRGAAQLGPAVHPALTGGIVTAWMGKGGRGRSLVGLFIALLEQGLREMAATRGREETPLVVALALSDALARAGDALADALPSPPVDRYLKAAALSGLWLAARTGLGRAWREAGRAADDPLLLRLEAALAPAPLLGGRAGVLGGGVTLYGCELSAGVPRADEQVAKLAAGGDLALAQGEVAAALLAEPDLARRAAQAVATARVRELLAAAVATAEAGGKPNAVAEARALLCGPGRLASELADDGARKALGKALAAAAPGGEAAALLGRAAALVKAWRPKDPGAPLGLSREEAAAAYAVTASALLADLAVARLGFPARRALSFRTGREAEGGADAEWEAGRLYRLSARPGPILRTAVDRPVGHLFADVKDFTRRTALLGQAAVAEFLRREFYGPILGAAREHFGGMGHLADRGGVTLNNLLGDAVSFAGPIDAMVALARAIRAQLAAYRVRLAREISSEEVARQIAAIEAAHADALLAARSAAAQAEAALAAEPAGTPRHAALQARLQRAQLDGVRLAEERERALSRARGEALEAGTFLSFGPAPLVVSIEDDVFGRNRVAIAERINESARGTARAPAARARADAALAEERRRRGSRELAHAWSVFVGPPLALPLPPEAEEEALRRLRAGDAQGAMRALAGPVREALEAAARGGDARPGDIYNGGAALSEAALEAFLAEAAARREVRRVSVPIASIPEALRARWYYGEEELDLVACFHGARLIELFRRVGAASFKGLGQVVVWELAAEEGGPAALAEALGPLWLKGA